jgi:fibronectin-binding autotransporter adhesin
LVIQLSTLRYTGASASTDRGFTVNDLATVEVSNAATNLTFGGVVAGSGLLSKSGPGTLTLTNPSLTYTGVVQVEEGKLTLATNLTTSVSVNVYSAMMELAAGGGSNRVIKTPDLYIDPAGKLNLQDNKLIITTAGSVGTWNGSAYTGITGLIRSGKGSGNTWNGTTGIVTAQSDAVGHNYTSIGIAKGFEVKSSTIFITGLWAGQTITGTDTLVMYTYGGDANLDGKLNIDDYVKIDTGIASNLTGWANGDFNYDGKVNIDDYTTAIDANIGNQSGIFPTSSGASGGFASAGRVSAVPEPAAGVFVVAGISLMRRRRRT